MDESRKEPKRKLFQLRRKESRAGGRDPWYAPERDLAHIGASLPRAAMAAMEEEWWEPWFKQYMTDQRLCYDDLPAAARCFGRAMTQIIHAKDPVVALEESGFTKLPPAIQMIFYTRLGQCFLAAIWSGVKDIRRPESDPPAEISELLEDIEAKFGDLLNKHAPNGTQ